MEIIVKNEARRDFLKVSGSAAGGLALAFYLPAARMAQAADGGSPNAWVKIAADNTVTIMVARSEMGQGVYTSMPMLIAEELEVDVNAIKVEFAPPAEVYINSLLGGQLTGGSTAVRDAWEKLRKAGASARMMLVAAAADNWGVDASKCSAANGMIKGPGGKKATYGSVAAKASTMEVPKEVPLKPASQFKVVGNTKQKRLDTAMKVRGTAGFGIDTRIPGMKYAAVAMAPMMGGSLISYDDTRAKNMPGVHSVVQYSRGVAVVAKDYWTAKKAVALLDPQWDAGPNADLDMTSLWSKMEDASNSAGAVFRESGDADQGLAQAANMITAEYRLPFQSHSPLEPQNTFAHVTADKALIITPTQFQQLVPHVVAGATGLKPEQVEVQTTFLGGGFGRRVEVDYAIDAAEISKASGEPVMMIWSREDDMTHDSYRPGGIFKFTAGVDAKGKLTALKFKSTSPSISSRLFPSIVKDGIDPFAVEGIDNFPYLADAGMNFSYVMHDTGVQVGYWRGVSHNLNAVALECFIDELATNAGADPIQYRIDMLDMGSTKHAWSGLSAGVPVGARMKNVLEELRKKANFGKKMPAGKGQGIAVMEGYNSIVGIVAEVSVDESMDVVVDKVTTVVDGGTLIHPDQALAQVQGSINFGQGAGMFSEITVKNGIVQQDNFDSYRAVRINETPRVMDTHFIKSDGAPGGLGEPATAVIVPAIANAIHAAIGKRVRTFPALPENVAAG
ncbi:MAG: molybdopterin cofactor-binding domain-containing protein [Burkholderiales bacterium]|jgi:isoquinoline 1-oxidoreductase beta subunit|tara:strand:+ start:53 stop:2251 length:2199 start_codon:yes stop_codon:yes gene_type:complete